MLKGCLFTSISGMDKWEPVVCNSISVISMTTEENFYILLNPHICWIKFQQIIWECTFLLCFLKRLSKHSFKKDPLSLAFYMKNLPEFQACFLPHLWRESLTSGTLTMWRTDTRQGGLADTQEADKLGGFMKVRKNSNWFKKKINLIFNRCACLLRNNCSFICSEI